MHVAHIASELAPIAKVGGLADVLLGLNHELSRKGHNACVIIPKYDCINTNEIQDLSLHSTIQSYYDGEWFANSIWTGFVENLKVYFIEPHHPRLFFNRGCFYGCEDDVERYLFFSRAALDFIAKMKPPDIIHVHDWQTAAIAPLYHEIFQNKFRSKIIFTIHNIEYQGKCAPFNLDRIGLSGSKLLTEDKMQDLYYPETVNLLKGGIVYANYITTVSPTYSWEVTTIEGGRGLDFTIKKHLKKFEGVLNGIDNTYWNPETDRYLPVHFSARENPKTKKDSCIVDAKGAIKQMLRQRLGLAEEHRPIIGCITRLVPQKGIEMIKHVIQTITAKGGQFVLLGSSPIPSISAEFYALKTEFNDHPHVQLILQHQEDLAHLIFGGSDIFIVPSLFEPCGLTQLIAMRYGAIPIVRKTGGLADTVFDIDSDAPKDKTNGYVFEHPNNQGIDSALDRAIHRWYDSPDQWRKLVIHAMNQDFSWNKPSDRYIEIYKKQLED